MGEEQAGGVVGKRERRVRVGETPRQQIRKAKATTRRQFSAEDVRPPLEWDRIEG